MESTWRGITSAEINWSVEARYPYQVWELEVPLTTGRFDDDADVEALVNGFHVAHERAFTVKQLGQAVECLNWKARFIGHLRTQPPERGYPRASVKPDPTEYRSAFLRMAEALKFRFISANLC
jgi:N-methylhydantoinase A